MALCSDPLTRISVPVVTDIGESAQRRFDVVPALFIFEAAADEFGDEGASLTRSDAPIECLAQGVVQCYVQTHVRKIASGVYVAR